MIKKLLITFILVLQVMLIASCTKTLHCDNCGKEVYVNKTSNMEEHWQIYCESCNEELFGDDPLLGNPDK